MLLNIPSMQPASKFSAGSSTFASANQARMEIGCSAIFPKLRNTSLLPGQRTAQSHMQCKYPPILICALSSARHPCMQVAFPSARRLSWPYTSGSLRTTYQKRQTCLGGGQGDHGRSCHDVIPLLHALLRDAWVRTLQCDQKLG